MDWLRNLLNSLGGGMSSMTPAQWGQGLGALGQIYGHNLAGKGFNRQFEAQRRRFEDDRRMRDDYNRRLDEERAEKQRMYEASIEQQDALAGERRAQLEASLSRYENDFDSDLQTRFEGLMSEHGRAPATSVSQHLEGKGPKVIQENLERERAKRNPRTDRKVRGKAWLTANQGALAGQAQKDLAAQDLLKNLSFISQDAEQTANRRQMMFPTQQKYQSIYTGDDPKADMYKAMGGTLVNWGQSKNPGALGQLGSALFGQFQTPYMSGWRNKAQQ